MFSEANRELTRLCKRLNERSLNYTVQMRLWCAEGIAKRTSDAIVQQAIAKGCVVAKEGESCLEELIREFLAAANYQGDSGSHPHPTFTKSLRGQSSIERAARLLEELFGSRSAVRWVRLSEGHPFYPVFWDFAFVVDDGTNLYVFIGSGSD